MRYQPQEVEPPVEPVFLTLPEAAKYISHGESTIYKLLGLKKLTARKAGKRLLITMESLKEYATLLPPAKIKRPAPRKRRGA